MSTSRLWIREPSGRIREHPLDDLPPGAEGFVIGRDGDADIVLNDQAVSREHARLTCAGGEWKIADLGSSNKTFVNGDPVQQSPLQSGDHIGIGDCELHLIGEVAKSTAEDSKTQVLTRLGRETGPAPAGGGERAAQILHALYRLSRELDATGEPSQFLDQALRLLTEELEADRAAVLIHEQDTLVCQAVHSRTGQALRGFVLSQTIFHELMQSREAVLSRDTADDSRFREQASVVGEEIRSVIAAPIRQGDRIHGILYLDRVERDGAPFQTEDLYGVAVAGEVLSTTLNARTEVQGLEQQREVLVRTLIETHPIVGTSPAIQRVREFIRRAAPTASTVLILGETGTGKELVARGIHYQSPRKGKPFIPINCAAIPETLVESELFGHERGAFTGAVERKIGKFEAAEGGTVFLDEIGELPLGAQGKLLRLLEERCFERVGGTNSVEVDVRIVAATNRDLAEESEKGSFREDLYYRLNVLQVNVPPLRDRPEDLGILIDHFLDQFSAQVGTHKKLSDAARERLLSQAWPGNVRQLRNAIENCVVMALGDTIDVDDLPQHLGPSASTARAAAPEWTPRSIQDVEREHIQRVLDHVRWNKSKAAEILGIERSTLYARIKNYGLSEEG